MKKDNNLIKYFYNKNWKKDKVQRKNENKKKKISISNAIKMKWNDLIYIYHRNAPIFWCNEVNNNKDVCFYRA